MTVLSVLALLPARPVASQCLDYGDHLHWICGLSIPARSVAVSGRYAYVAAQYEGLCVLDVSDPAHPVPVGQVETPGDATDIAVRGDYAYIADFQGGVQVVSVSDPTRPVIIASVPTSYAAVCIALDGAYVYVGEARLPYPTQSKVEIIDLSVANCPTVVAEFTTPSWAWDIALAKNRAYVGVFGAGLKRVDISNPRDPHSLGTVALPGTSLGVAVDSDHAYVANGSEGLQIVRITEGISLGPWTRWARVSV